MSSEGRHLGEQCRHRVGWVFVAPRRNVRPSPPSRMDWFVRKGELLVLERANEEWGEKERVWGECGNGSGRRVEGGVRDSLSHGGDTVHRRFGALAI